MLTDRIRIHRFFSAFLVIAAAFLITFKVGDLLNWKISLVLASLIILSFFVTFLELIFLTLISVFIFSSQPLLPPQLVVFFAMPTMLFLFRKIIFSFEGWVNSAVLIIFGVLIFYAAANLGLFMQNPISIFFVLPIIFKDIALSAFWGFLVFSAFDYFYAT